MWSGAAHVSLMAESTSTNLRTDRLVVRVSPDDKRVIERAAALSGQSMASFVIAHAVEAAEKVVEGHGRIRLNARNSKRFAECLLAPARRVPRKAKEAFEDYQRRVWEV